MFRKIARYFDKLEDRVRGHLSRYPILYTLIGGAAIVMFWRGVWETQDEVMYYLEERNYIPPEWAWIDGPLSIFVSVCILLVTGLFVSFFVTDRIILTGLKQEKKLAEKTEREVQEEAGKIDKIEKEIAQVERDVKEIRDKLL